MPGARPARTAALFAALGLLTTGQPAASQLDETKASAVKAAYLRYIAEFTTWPDHSFVAGEAPIVIGTLADDASGVISLIQKRIDSKGLKAQRRRIEIRRLTLEDLSASSPANAERASPPPCHLLYVAESERSDWPRIHSLLAGRAIVTVSEIRGFSSSRGMIEFVVSTSDRRVAMHIDLDAVRGAGLKLSSRLLGLKSGVKIVRDGQDSVTPSPSGDFPG